MIPVVLESPYQGDVIANVEYAKECALDCLSRGEAPFASHLLYTQMLDDKIPEQRTLGIEAGFAWGEWAHKVVVYTDLGISPGMRKAIEWFTGRFKTVEFRSIRFGSEVP